VAAAFKDAPDLETAKHRLTDTLSEQASEIERHAGRVDQEPAGPMWASTFLSRAAERNFHWRRNRWN